MTKLAPLTHQKHSLKVLAKEPEMFDMSDAGTGKTPVHIWDFAHRRRKGGGKGLVLCPKSLIKSAWGNDFKKFAPDIKVSLAYADNRDEAFDTEADVYVTNIDAAEWLDKKPKSFFKNFEVLIIDESTSIKHHTSKRSRCVGRLRKFFSVVRLLSGTPTSNGITDLWHQMFVLDRGGLLGQSFYRFRDACCIPEQVGNNANAIRWHDKPGIELTVGALIAKKVIRHKFEDCVDIPPNHRFAMEYELSNKHRKMYEELKRDSMLITKTKTVRAVNGAVLYGKLLQCASGATYSDPDDTDNSEYALIDVGRYELINDLIEARKHSVVFFSWRHQRDQLIRLAEKSGFSYALIDGTVTKKGAREKIVEDYQAGAYKVLFAHPQSAGHGLTLTRGTTTIFASPTPNLEHFLQAYKRIYRISQTEKTETIMVIAKDTIDEYVWSQCQTKDIKQVDLLSYLEK